MVSGVVWTLDSHLFFKRRKAVAPTISRSRLACFKFRFVSSPLPERNTDSTMQRSFTT